jgi:hypothetical protein
MLSLVSEVSNCETIYLGNIGQHIDPFFDIDLQRHITKVWLHKKGTKIIFLFCSDESSLKFLFSTADYIKRKMTEIIKIVLFINPEILNLTKDLKFDFIASDLNILIIWLEDLIKQIRSKI